mmetsp:Transcript_4144/g.18641  ORF Transcript_4144/g.18641 Transcript_4144/m.18641 type:complete len:463 (+) Transcript_4144:1823-3211(+)
MSSSISARSFSIWLFVPPPPTLRRRVHDFLGTGSLVDAVVVVDVDESWRVTSTWADAATSDARDFSSSRNLRNFSSSSSVGGGTRTTTTVASSCSPRSVPSAASMIRSAASLTHGAVARTMSPHVSSETTFQTPSDANTNMQPSAGALNRFTSGVHTTWGASKSPMARDTAYPPGYERIGPTSLPSRRIRPSLAPASVSRLASRGSSGEWHRVSHLVRGVWHAALRASSFAASSFAGSSFASSSFAASSFASRPLPPLYTSSAPESPALATTTSTLGSAPHGSICNSATHAVVPPSMATFAAFDAFVALDEEAVDEKRHRGRHALERRSPTADARRFGSGLASDDCGDAAPIFPYEDSSCRNASVQHVSRTAPRPSAPWSRSARSMCRSTYDDAEALTCPSNTPKQPARSPVSPSPSASSSRFVVVGLRPAIAGCRPYRERARAASTLCSARNLSSCFRGAI